MWRECRAESGSGPGRPHPAAPKVCAFGTYVQESYMRATSFPTRLLREITEQLRYQASLSRNIGPLNSLRARLLGLRDRRPGHRAELTMHPASAMHPVRIRVASTDPETYHQVLVEQQYSCVADLDARIVVDCGANAGFASAYLLSRFPDARLIALEPFPDNHALCRRNLAPYGDRAETRPVAVWSHACRLVIDGHGGHEWGVKVRPAREGEAGDVDAIGIADLGLPRIDLLKIDIEGSEEVLFSEGADAWLPTVGAIAVELHGPACERAFHSALVGYDYELGSHGELTIARNIRRR
jgi:FkbM family methyltransferase